MSLELNSCFLFDYPCGQQKVKGGHGSNIASSSASSIPLNLGVGCAPSCWPIFGFRNLLGARRGRRGQFFVQSDNRFSGRGGGVGSLPRAWRRVGVGAAGAKKNCEIGVGFSFAALSVFRLRRAEAASALWIPHWHSEPFESQGARAAKRYVNGNLVEREKHHLNLHLNLGVGCAPSCWADFRIPKPPGCSQGAQRAV